MSPRPLVLAALVLAAGVSLCTAGEVAAPVTLDQALDLTPRYHSDRARANATQEAARWAMVRDAGLAYGTQGGYAQRAGEIQQLLARRASQLDRIYNFTPLVENGRMLVPSVMFTHHEQVLEGEAKALRETSRVLRVTDPARLVTLPPTWRDWLTIGPLPPQRPDDVMLPASGDERSVWVKAVTDGWAVGRAQADAVFSTQLESLTQAYTGRVRYRELVAQHMLDPAKLGQTDLGIVREDEVVRIDDSLYQVREDARFADPASWRPAVQSPPSKGGQP